MAFNDHAHRPSVDKDKTFSLFSASPAGPAATRSEFEEVGKIPHILPHERVFPIQIGSELFKLSGASISSDAPSYFSQFFRSQIDKALEAGEDPCSHIRTLYIDRDPATFHDISLHLQGYHVKPRDGTHFVRLFADAQFYSLPRLISRLFEEDIFISIGHREFQIPRDLFNGPGNTPNFFSLGFALFFSRPDDLFPGLDRQGLLRPPSIAPPAVDNRSAEVFAELLDLLRGYPVAIRDETHRAALLRDCRYFNFKGLEQRLIPHHISFNQSRGGRPEIVLRIEDIFKSGISVAVHDDDDAAALHPGLSPLGDVAGPLVSWVQYARPYVDARPAELILEIGGEATRLHHPPGSTTTTTTTTTTTNHNKSGRRSQSPRVEFFRDVRTRVARLFEVLATKLNLPPTTQPLGLLMASGGAGSQPPTPGHTPLSEDRVRAVVGPDAHVVLDGKPFTPPSPSMFVPSGRDDLAAGYGMREDSQDSMTSRKRRRLDTYGQGQGEGEGEGEGEGASSEPDAAAWIVKTGQWRLMVRGPTGGDKMSAECVLVAVRLDAYSSESTRNASRGFLGAP
ncbi:hypothetical protein SODALDRAFT_335500 [Sodiomyces alkalinus F11]|uniref:Potassium channel tetramerisation-type BTB domain-containing protein n=1 Tax=Sodiomyces alkalinus (strain CBS 110278 / VKM F-3762 / F11) TaxID=1314773 RepID=A0A3N2PPG5_SODAK|nr:hypothetical protein SODALDRAFT_335500 [Sodiomyces alkalinus F11]ROT36399.1 hypothetical protein SODALDRAFT_335500 [Sodiomyces alkalinus F11]